MTMIAISRTRSAMLTGTVRKMEKILVTLSDRRDSGGVQGHLYPYLEGPDRMGPSDPSDKVGGW
jgi:hypothetical protein